MKTFAALDGALLVDKPAGPTSHDIVDHVRRMFGIPKAGHCGTLDPQATGLLVLVLGKATKLSEKLMADDKVYSGDVCFGVTTSSYDADGEVVSALPVPLMTLDEINEAASTFVGDHLQMPPMVSAIKKDGVPLYKLARKGIEVERKPRLVHIYRFRFTDYQEPHASFRVACTKGTYVRSLAHDLGQKLGCGAHLTTLRRLVSGRFDVQNAIQFEDLCKLDPDRLPELVIPMLQLSAMG